jgi:hypothetical protein
MHALSAEMEYGRSQWCWKIGGGGNEQGTMCVGEK